jgi:deoxyadenosine/deoxycytidine kinase
VDEHNPWLERFYAGGVDAMRATALNLQLHFLATRFESMRRIRGAGGSWVLDRTWYEDAEIFARGHYDEGLMSDVEWELYRRLYVELLHSPAARPPRLLVYCTRRSRRSWSASARAGVPRSARRRTSTGRAARALRALDRAFRGCPVLRLDVREYDLVADPAAIETIAAQVRARLEPELPQTELFPGAGAAVSGGGTLNG